MNPADRAARRRFTLAPQRLRPLRALRELRWNADRRRHLTQPGEIDRRHPLDEGYVADAMARQIEEIRNLPEVAY